MTAPSKTRGPVVVLLPIPHRARRAWRELAEALDRSNAEIPCVTALSGLWTSHDETERAMAAQFCTGCTAVAQCGTFADQARITCDVWGGTDRTTTQAPQQQSEGTTP